MKHWSWLKISGSKSNRQRQQHFNNVSKARLKVERVKLGLFVFERVCRKHCTCLNCTPVGNENTLYSASLNQPSLTTSQLLRVLEGVEPFRRFHLVPRALAKIAKHLARVSDSCTDCAASWWFRFHPTLALLQWINTNNLVNIWRTIHCIVRHCVNKPQRMPL